MHFDRQGPRNTSPKYIHYWSPINTFLIKSSPLDLFLVCLDVFYCLPCIYLFLNLFPVKEVDLKQTNKIFYRWMFRSWRRQLKTWIFNGWKLHYLTLMPPLPPVFCACACFSLTSRWSRWLAGVREHAADTPVSSQFWFSVAVLLLCAMWHLCAAYLPFALMVKWTPSPCHTHSHTHKHTYIPFYSFTVLLSLTLLPWLQSYSNRLFFWLLIYCSK